MTPVQMDFTFEPSVKIRMKPLQYLFKMGAGSYCLGIFDNQNQGTLIGGITVRNILVQAGCVAHPSPSVPSHFLFKCNIRC